jgi:hypothetical protein
MREPFSDEAAYASDFFPNVRPVFYVLRSPL